MEGTGRSRARLVSLPGEASMRAEALGLYPPGTDPRPPVRQEAIHSSGVVQVTVDGRGRVVDLTVSPRWRDRLDPADLPAACFEAFQAAVEQAAYQFAMATLAARDRGEALTAHADGEPSRRVRPPSPVSDPVGWQRWIDDLRADTQAQREHRIRVEAEAVAAPMTRTGPAGCLAAAVAAGRVTGLTGDPRQLRYASTSDLQRDALVLLSS